MISHGKGAMDGIGGTVKYFVMRSICAGSAASCDVTSYTEIATQTDPKYKCLKHSSTQIEERSPKMLPV